MDNAAVAVQRATQLQFIKQTLLPRILATDAELSSSKLIESEAALQDQLDGFMSAIYNLNITTSTTVDGTDKQLVTPIIMRIQINKLSCLFSM